MMRNRTHIIIIQINYSLEKSIYIFAQLNIRLYRLLSVSNVIVTTHLKSSKMYIKIYKIVNYFKDTF